MAKVIHHAKLMVCVVLSPVACLAAPYSSTLSHRSYDFRRYEIGHEMCFILSPNLSEIFLILRRI